MHKGSFTHTTSFAFVALLITAKRLLQTENKAKLAVADCEFTIAKIVSRLKMD